MVTEKGRGSTDRIDLVEHGILCMLALSKKKSVLLQNYQTEDNHHKAVIEWMKEDLIGITAKTSCTKIPHLITGGMSLRSTPKKSTQTLKFKEGSDYSYDVSKDNIVNKEKG